jgi:hypothetical protein
VLEGRGDFAGARDAFRRALQRGSPHAQSRLDSLDGR